MSKFSNKTIVVIAFSLILIGIFLIFGDYLTGKKNKAYDKINISLFSENDGEIIDNTPQNVAEGDILISETKNGKYLGVLKIDKINLENGFYDKDNSLNNVDYNVTLLGPSNYPNEAKGNTILVAHSGNSNIGYFKHLWKLNIGDFASISYKSKAYVYKIVNIYNEQKDGTVNIVRNKNKTTLTLVTCTKNSDTEQTVYIAELQ